jgi:hypothetical protein
MHPMHKSLSPILLAAIAFAAGCEQQSPMVYVLESPQEVTLTSSVSSTAVKQGETVVLRVQRRAVGKWKQIPRDQLTPGQCWLYTPPPELEQEVADNVTWEVVPDNAVEFDTTYRMDHTRHAVMKLPGRIRLTPLSPVRCEKDRLAEGPTIRIEVG